MRVIDVIYDIWNRDSGVRVLTRTRGAGFAETQKHVLLAACYLTT